jgi:hypothetical protein
MYGEQRAALLLACRSLGIESILDIGSKYPGELPTHVGNIPVQSLGYLSGDQASAAIAQCRAGIVAYGPDRWEKSGVLSTYAAHGLIPVVAPRNGWDGLSQQSRPFLLAQELHALAGSHGSIPLETLQAAADHAHRFYQKYQSLSAALNTVATALNSIPPR